MIRTETPIIRPALPEECAELSALCLRSKAWWGYEALFLEACREELSITGQDIGDFIRVADWDGSVAGVAQVKQDGGKWFLDKLFVDPPFIGKGIGAALMLWAINTAREHDARCLVIHADPGAADFYRSFGAVDDGTTGSSSIPGRLLPRLLLDLR